MGCCGARFWSVSERPSGSLPIRAGGMACSGGASRSVSESVPPRRGERIRGASGIALLAFRCAPPPGCSLYPWPAAPAGCCRWLTEAAGAGAVLLCRSCSLRCAVAGPGASRARRRMRVPPGLLAYASRGPGGGGGCCGGGASEFGVGERPFAAAVNGDARALGIALLAFRCAPPPGCCLCPWPAASAGCCRWLTERRSGGCRVRSCSDAGRGLGP